MKARRVIYQALVASFLAATGIQAADDPLAWAGDIDGGDSRKMTDGTC